MEKCVDIMDCAITSVVDDLCKHGDPGEIPWKPLRDARSCAMLPARVGRDPSNGGAASTKLEDLGCSSSFHSAQRAAAARLSEPW